MKDQNNIPDTEGPEVKMERAYDLFIESVLKPDSQLRLCAKNQNCYEELMQIRESVVEYLKELRGNH